MITATVRGKIYELRPDANELRWFHQSTGERTEITGSDQRQAIRRMSFHAGELVGEAVNPHRS